MVPPAPDDRTGPPLDVLLPLDGSPDGPDGPDAPRAPGPGGGSGPRRLDPRPGEPALGALYAHPDPGAGRAWVRATMIASLDGAATGADGRSGSLNGPADHRVFDLLRSLADVVLVGAGTVRAEGYRELPVRPDLAAGRAARGQHPDLRLAIVTRSGDLPDDLLDGDLAPWVVTVADRPDPDALRDRIGDERLVVAGSGDVDLATAVAELASRGAPRVLAEGGARVLGDLLAAGLVDDLCLTTVPELVAGPARRVVDRAGWFTPPLTARPAHLLHGDGVLLGRWVLRSSATRDVRSRAPQGDPAARLGSSA